MDNKILNKYRINIFDIPILSKIKDWVWKLMTTTKYQRQLEGKQDIEHELEIMSKEKIKNWQQKKGTGSAKSNNEI